MRARATTALFLGDKAFRVNHSTSGNGIVHFTTIAHYQLFHRLSIVGSVLFGFNNDFSGLPSPSFTYIINTLQLVF